MFWKTALEKAVSKNNLSAELRTGRRIIWPEHGQ